MQQAEAKPDLRESLAGPMLSVWDRQFDDVATMRHFAQRGGDAFVVRAKQQDAVFTVESAVEGTDGQGRRVLDEIGLLGQGKRQMRVRRVTLFRGGKRNEKPVGTSGPKRARRTKAAKRPTPTRRKMTWCC